MHKWHSIGSIPYGRLVLAGRWRRGAWIVRIVEAIQMIDGSRSITNINGGSNFSDAICWSDLPGPPE